jgi:alpha-mannosidase
MPDFTRYTMSHLAKLLPRIKDAAYTRIGLLELRAWCTREPVPFSQRQSGQERHLSVGDKWGDLFDCAWFLLSGKVPPAGAGHKVVLLIDLNGEGCAFDAQGTPVRGLTTTNSVFDTGLGSAGKRVLPITDHAQGGEAVEVWIDAGCNDLFGTLQGNGTVKEAAIAICHDETLALYYDLELLLDLLHVLPPDSARHAQILNALNGVADTLGACSPPQARQAREHLAPLLAMRGGDPSLILSAVGHAHLDLAWLWPIRETIRKGARTFATALALMERYPAYVFGASQPQLFQWMKEHYPPLYACIKDKVRAGRLEAQGAMWVEADTNVTSGEALARQILLGKRFFKQEFGLDVNTLWLPDVFGYSATLPQLLRQAGVDYFMTQKLSWNLVNAFPHHSFHWQGIDGSSVLAHMLAEETYNSPALPHCLAKVEKNYRDKGVSGHALMLFGIGDGGGGPGEEHLERLARLENLAGVCPVRQQPAASFFDQWAKDAARFPAWVGELYLERHQGTLTTQARNKWYNRRMELALRELEWTAVLAEQLAGSPYPAERLQALWRETLLYQFHDILPGSSIKRVYDECLPRYQAMLEEISRRIQGNDELLARRINTSGLKEPVVVYNSLSWERTEWIEIGQGWAHVTVPPMGYLALDAAITHIAPDVTAAEDCLENDLLRVTFAKNGWITSIYDKQARREVLSPGQAANRLAVYEDSDRNADFPAWDFPPDYANRAPRYLQLVSCRPHVDGPCAILEQVYRLEHSEVVQEIVLSAGSRRLDFRTRARWRETSAMLRTSFPVAVHAEEATFEIQFGHVRRPTHRNTTWDLARDEVAAHKWADLSQRDYGVALLNDSKYGHKVRGNVIDLNLLRSVPYPGPQLVADEDVAPGEAHHGYTDQCDHAFTYALYPHPGDHIEGCVAQAGYALNVPLRVVPTQPRSGPAPAKASFLQIDAPNVIVEAVKKAEDGNDVILRLYECEHRGTRTTLRFNFPVASAAEATLMEEPLTPLKIKGGSAALEFRPFEIKTLRVAI